MIAPERTSTYCADCVSLRDVGVYGLGFRGVCWRIRRVRRTRRSWGSIDIGRARFSGGRVLDRHYEVQAVPAYVADHVGVTSCGPVQDEGLEYYLYLTRTSYII